MMMIKLLILLINKKLHYLEQVAQLGAMTTTYILVSGSVKLSLTGKLSQALSDWTGSISKLSY